MTTAYTPILKLALPVTGELSGTWGTVVNDNITSMIEQAVAGLITISTWTTNAHTLTTADGTSSEARCAMLVLATGAGGTALSAAGELICPAASKMYVVKNGAAYAVTLKTSTGSGVAIPAGETAFLFCDGTNVNQCVTSFVNATLSGNLTVNGNTTLGDATSDTITATGQFDTDLLPSTDNARDLGSTAKSWRTLYCDTSVLVPLVTATNVQVTNIKANDGTAAITIADSTGAVTVSTLLNVDNLRLETNTLSSTDTNGNITLAPNGTGDVQLDADTIRVGDSGANVTITSNGAGDLILNTNSGTNSGSITIEDGANGAINLTPNGTGAVVLPLLRLSGSSSGYVGLKGAAAAGSTTYTLPAADGTSGQVLSTNGSATLSWATAGGGAPGGSTTQVQYNNAGSFGGALNLTWDNPNNTLNVHGIRIGRGGGSIQYNLAITQDANAFTSGTTGGYNIAIGSQVVLDALTDGNYNVAIGGLALRNITSGSSNVAVGNSALTTLNSTAGNDNNTAIGGSAASTLVSGSNNIVIGYFATTSSTTVSNEITLGNSSIATLRCQVTTITALSDARDKKDVQDIPLGVSFIQRLHPVSFVWNTRDGGKVDVPEFGFIAQELRQAQADYGVTLPGLVHDINPERLEAAPGTLIPVLVKAVQELQAQIDDLKRQLAARG